MGLCRACVGSYLGNEERSEDEVDGGLIKVIILKGNRGCKITYVNNEGVKWYEKFQRGALGRGHFLAYFIFDCRQSFRDSMADIP